MACCWGAADEAFGCDSYALGSASPRGAANDLLQGSHPLVAWLSPTFRLQFSGAPCPP